MSGLESEGKRVTKGAYTLRFPFRPSHWVSGLEPQCSFFVDGYRYLLRSEQPQIVLEVDTFEDEAAALSYVPRVWGALAWLAVQMQTGFVVELLPEHMDFLLEQISTRKHARVVQGRAGGDAVSIVPSGMGFSAFGLQATATVTWSAAKYLPKLEEALNRPNVSGYFYDEKLRTAIELLSAMQGEASLRSRILTCVTALEVLARPAPKHSVLQEILDSAIAQVDVELASVDTESDVQEALESLKRDLDFKRYDSLRSSMRKLVIDSLQDIPVDERNTRAKELVWAYDIRSSLVHTGAVSKHDLGKAHDIVYRALFEILERADSEILGEVRREHES